MKTVFVHPERCIGCRQCEFACAVEHSQSKDTYRAHLESPLPRSRIHVEPGIALSTSFPNKCRHCNPAPCMAVCPTTAISRAQEGEIVVIDGRRCITCAMCALVCPFDVITYHHTWEIHLSKDVALKCDHCIERQKQGRIPACAEVCKVQALQFGEVNELVKASRTRLSREVSVAVSQVAPEILPAHLKAWRDLGASTSSLAEEKEEQP